MKMRLWKWEKPASLIFFPAFFYLYLLWSLRAFDPFLYLHFLDGFHGLPELYLGLLRKLEQVPGIVWVWKASLLLSAAGPQKRVARVAAFLLTSAFLPIQNSYGILIKSSLILYPALLALCFLPGASSKREPTWVLEYLRFLVLFVFVASGIAKLIRAPQGWLSEAYFRDAVTSEWLLADLTGLPLPWLAGVGAMERLFFPLAIIVLLLELACAAGIFLSRARPACAVLILLLFSGQYLAFGWFFSTHLALLPLLFALEAKEPRG